MTKIKLTGYDIEYQEYGQGDEVFIRSQSSAFSSSQINILSRFPSNYHFYMLDLGRRFDLAGSSNIFDFWADTVYQFSREMGLDKFFYWGTSHGGGIGFHLALTHPEVLKGFVSEVGVPHDRSRPLPEMDKLGQRLREAGDDIEKARQVARATMATMFNPTNDERRLQLRERYLQNAVESRIQRRGEESPIKMGTPFPDCDTNEKLAARLSLIKVPTLLIVGAQDPQVSTEVSLIALKSIPGAKAVFFQDEGHFISMESPEKLADEITLFVNQINKAASH